MIKKTNLLFVISMFALTALLGAVEKKETVLLRPSSVEDKTYFLEKMDQEKEENPEEENTEEKQIDKIMCLKSAKKLSQQTEKVAKTKGFFSYDPFLFLPSDGHFLVSASTQRKAITTEDGSVWKIANADLYTLLNWQPNDFLFVTQNNSWFSSYGYRIINHTTKESVQAYLYEGPVVNGGYTHYIFAMDLDVGEIVFDNNVIWSLCEADYPTYRNWAINDPIIIGINTGWRSEYTHILINVNTDNWVRARIY